MRLITKHKLYRAFRELDGYPDEQCERFIQAALGSVLRRLGRWLLCIAVTVTILAFAILAIALTLRAMRINNDTAVGWTGIGLFIIGGPLLTIIVRDLLLWRRIGYVLRAQGCCGECGYSLIGMPLTAQSTITCPECGMECAVDPSLSELVREDDGRVHLKSSAQGGDSVRVFWTGRRRRLAKRFALAGVLVFIVLPALSFGTRELWVRYQARRAARDVVSLAQYDQFLKTLQPAYSDNTPRPDRLTDIYVLMSQAEDAARVDPRFYDAEDGSPVGYVSFDALLRPEPPPLPPPKASNKPSSQQEPTSDNTATESETVAESAGNEDDGEITFAEEQQQAERFVWELTTLTLEHGDRLGVFPLVRQAALLPPALPRPNMAGYVGPVTQLYFTDNHIRQLYFLAVARVHLASQTDSLPRFTEACLDLAAVNKLLATSRESIVLTTIRSITTSVVAKALARHSSQAWIDATKPLLNDPVDFDVLTTQAIDFGEFAQNDAAAWIFSDPGRTRFGKWSLVLNRLAEARHLQNLRLGGYDENRRATQARAQALRAYAAIPFHQRLDQSPPQPTSLVVSQFYDGFWPATMLLDKRHANAAMRLDALRVVMAIESYRVDHGTYPESLQSIVPRYIDAIPVDRFDGLPMKYKKMDPAQDPLKLGRGYLLYSVGDDGADDGGKELPVDQTGWNRSSLGYDTIINGQ